jgi:hypothetical protein
VCMGKRQERQVWFGTRGTGCVSVPHSDPAINEAADSVPRNILELVQWKYFRAVLFATVRIFSAR